MKELWRERQGPSDGSDMDFFSFWKPDPIPTRDEIITSVELHSLGNLKEVAERLFEVPRLTPLKSAIWAESEKNDRLRFRWEVEEGVVLQIKAEMGPPAPGEVLTIEAASALPKKLFYRLYVQIYEQFGVTVLDEQSHDFLSPKEFKAHLS